MQRDPTHRRGCPWDSRAAISEASGGANTRSHLSRKAGADLFIDLNVGFDAHLKADRHGVTDALRQIASRSPAGDPEQEK
jgi:hypothetical protein